MSVHYLLRKLPSTRATGKGGETRMKKGLRESAACLTGTPHIVASDARATTFGIKARVYRFAAARQS